MKVTIPAKEVELCDVCRRENQYLETCKFCGGSYCLSCRALIAGCIHQVDVCRNCGETPELVVIVEKHAPLIKAALLARDTEIEHWGSAQHGVQRTAPKCEVDGCENDSDLIVCAGHVP